LKNWDRGESLDAVNPPQYSQLIDGMTITIKRVTETEECYDRELDFEEEQIPIPTCRLARSE